jgi:serine-type D-Ala-D-Ala carboxypeptidase (penicillin-binding protein 5/6)
MRFGISSEQGISTVLLAVTLLFTPFVNFVHSQEEVVVSVALEPTGFVPVLQSQLSQTEKIEATVFAEAVYVMDLNSSSILLEKNADMPLSPASTTKLASVLVALDEYELSNVLEVFTAAGTDGASAQLLYGEKLSVQSLLEAMLIQSANDATMTVAESYPGGTTAFVAAMNDKARELHLLDTHFTNPVGFDSLGHVSTAHDLALLTRAALQKTFIAQTVALPRKTITDISGSYAHVLQSTNELLKQDSTVHGVKTGTTDQAGQVLITLVEREGHPVVIVLLNSTDRYSETAQLLSWIYQQYVWLSSDQLDSVLKNTVL